MDSRLGFGFGFGFDIPPLSIIISICISINTNKKYVNYHIYITYSLASIFHSSSPLFTLNKFLEAKTNIHHHQTLIRSNRMEWLCAITVKYGIILTLVLILVLVHTVGQPINLICHLSPFPFATSSSSSSASASYQIIPILSTSVLPVPIPIPQDYSSPVLNSHIQPTSTSYPLIPSSRPFILSSSASLHLQLPHLLPSLLYPYPIPHHIMHCVQPSQTPIEFHPIKIHLSIHPSLQKIPKSMPKTHVMQCSFHLPIQR